MRKIGRDRERNEERIKESGMMGPEEKDREKIEEEEKARKINIKMKR